VTDVVREDADGVAVLTLDRPEVLNALRVRTFEELAAHLDDIAAAPDDVGCVVLRGAGRSFSAGNDLKAMTAGDTPPRPGFQAETIDRLESIPQPVIASIRGHCFTGALEVVLACTLVIVSDTARIADTHGRWGMSPTWGMSQRLPRRIGQLRAAELMMTGRELSGREAVDWGLANRCVADGDLDAETTALARACLARSWHTLRSVKRLARAAQDLTLTDGLAHERATSRSAPDMAQQVTSFGASKS